MDPEKLVQLLEFAQSLYHEFILIAYARTEVGGLELRILSDNGAGGYSVRGAAGDWPAVAQMLLAEADRQEQARRAQYEAEIGRIRAAVSAAG